MSRIFLIDYENTGTAGLAGCEKLQKEDRIMLLFTKNNSKIDMSCIANHGDAEFRMIEVPAGKQSADLHIASYLGYLLSHPATGVKELNIVSKDTDFDNLLKFWGKKTNIKLKRIPNIGASAKNAAAEKKEAEAKKEPADKTEINNETMKALSNAGFNADIVGYVPSVVAKNIGVKNVKQQVYRAIISKYGQKQGLEIYSVIKKIVK